MSVRANGGRGWHAVRALLPALTAAACGTWALQWVGEMGGLASGGGGLVIGAAVAALAWRSTGQPAATLAWDGRGWSVDGAAGRLDLMLDLPGWLLVRLRPAAGGRARWVAVTAAEAGTDETLLRAALHAHVTHEAHGADAAGEGTDDAPARPAAGPDGH